MKKLLFVEDDPVTGTVYEYHFSSAGYTVQLANDAEKGLAALPTFKPDLIVLDLMLPRMNGIEFIRHVRANTKTHALPVIVFTNAYVSSMVADARKAGADQCLIKAQTSAEQLLSAVAQTLASAASAQSGFLAGAPAPSAAPAPPPPPVDPSAEFRKHAPQALSTLRRLAQSLLAAEREADRPPILLELFRIVHVLTTKASLAKAALFAQMISVLEALLKDLDEQPKHIDASTMRTVNQAIDFLDLLFRHAPASLQREASEFRVLIVDDEAVSRKAIASALERAFLKSVELDSPFAAYELLKKEAFDLVITDINMPGMDGLALCQKVRTLPAHVRTPVIFVTVLNAFEVRVRSAKSGGSDFIAKPFLSLELAVKALTQIARHQLKLRDEGPSTHGTFQAFSPKL